MSKFTYLAVFSFLVFPLTIGCNQEKEKTPEIRPQPNIRLEANFSKNVASTHYIIIESTEEKHSEDREKISDYCQKEAEKKLRVSSFFLKGQDKKPYFSIRRFDNMDESLLFLKTIRDSGIIDNGMKIFLLSQENYRRVIGGGVIALEEYEKFYEEEFKINK